MKMESLKSSKFDAFKGFEVENPLKVSGGDFHATTYEQYSSKDGGKTYVMVKSGVDRFDFGAGATSSDAGFPSTGAGDFTFYAYTPAHDERMVTALA